ncbi:hypothetical protein F6X37_32965 [Paraburkholderia sp. 31.1]|nr:hypothetical protein [Paraburkholderia sp. 31.1]
MSGVLSNAPRGLQNRDCRQRVVHGPPASPVTVVGVENNHWEDQGQRNAKTLMQILGGDAIQP